MTLKEAITIRSRQLSGWRINPVIAARAIEVIQQLAKPSADDIQAAMLEAELKPKGAWAWTRTK